MNISVAPKRKLFTLAERSFDIQLMFFLTAGLVLTWLAAWQIIAFHEISKGIALFGGGTLAILSAAIVMFPTRFAALTDSQWFGRWVLVPVAMTWLAWITLIAYTHHVEGWDEGDYVLSGMALRGYHVPYSPHRAPVIGFLCAAFVGWDRFLNPVLLGVLVTVVYLWVRRLLGAQVACLSLVVLFCQNLLLESTVDIMSELPAALLLVIGFILLTRESFCRAGLCFALAVFTRWNLAPIWVVVLLAVSIRFGIPQAIKFVGMGAAVFGAWYGITMARGATNPLLSVYEGLFLPGLAWSASLGEKPDFLLRTDFYLSHFFFLTPPVLFALVASPILNLRRHLHSESWVVLIVLPLSLLAYLVTMLNMGGLIPRFMAPIIPAAVVSSLYWVWKSAGHRASRQVDFVRIILPALFLVCAFGLWPLGAIVQARVKHNAAAVFSPVFQEQLRALDPATTLYGIPHEPLSGKNGHSAMVEARHTILFPSARFDFNGGLIGEPNSVESIRRLTAACHSGDLLLIQKRYASEFPPAAPVFSDEQWAVVRNP
jgi:hypothetical protein